MQSLIFQLSDEDDMDSFVLALGSKKTLQRMQKEYEDLVSSFVASLLVLHVVAAAKHHVILKDDTLKRMLPGSRF